MGCRIGNIPGRDARLPSSYHTWFGSTPRPIDPRVKQLEAENCRLQRKLQRAETIIALPKKVTEILEIPLKPLATD